MTDFGVFFFAALGDPATRTYRMMVDSAVRADRRGLAFVSTPERHFHRFGGAFPNPAVTSAALATVTERIQLRAGSVITPMHPPLRVVENFALVDCLSGGRVGISVGSGWNVNDFVLAPAEFAGRRERMIEDIATIRQVWRDGTWTGENPLGAPVTLDVFPRPVQAELPIWLTASRSEETFREAGRLGTHILTHLENQDVDALKDKIAAYRKELAANHPGRTGKVTVMMHTYLAETTAQAREVAVPWLRQYLLTAIDLESRAVKGGGKMSGGKTGRDFLTDERARARLAEVGVNRYLSGTSLIGSVEECVDVVASVREVGVDEIACLVDFVDDAERVVAGIDRIADLAERVG